MRLMDASEKRRITYLRQAFDLTPYYWDKVSAHQGGVCFVCGRKPVGRRLATDHSHDTGLFRGLLCNRCNALLGKIENNFKRFGLHKISGMTVERALLSLAAYLHSPPAVTALGREVFGYPGKIGTKAYRKWVKKRAAL
jgi:hypothetical protein